MIALFSSVLVASLAGSFHCVAMCGPFVACGVGTGGGNAKAGGIGRFRQLPYHLGRLGSYGLVGMIAGSLGALLNRGGLLAGVQRTAMLVAAAGLILFGSAMLLQRWGALRRISLPAPLHRLYVSTFARLQKAPPAVRALCIGALSALLPCGWLYAFAILAAGAGSPWRGAVVMVAFWLGTMPLLLVVGAGAGWLTPRLQRRLPAVAAWILIGAGVYGLAIRWDLPQWDSLQSPQAAADRADRTDDAPVVLPGDPSCH